MNLEHTLTAYTKINPKRLKYLNIKHDTMKVLEEIISIMRSLCHFSDINHTNVFLGQSPKAIQIKTKINKWDLIKHKLWHRKGNNKQNEKTSYRMGENICK